MGKKVRPKVIRLEASSVCQLKCPSCPTASKEILPIVGSGYLRFKDFKKLLDENSYVRKIEVSNWGELFLNPDILQIIEYAYQQEVALSAQNGVNLNNIKEDMLEGLVKYKFHSMSCSLDGASIETYKQYRIGGNFDTVIQNIKKINLFKQQYQSAYPLLTWQFVVFGHNEHEIPMARKMANELNMSFRPKLSWDAEFSPVRDPEYVRKEIGAASQKEYIEEHDNVQRSQCRQLWDQPQINWNGKILGCCFNYWGDFGENAFTDGLYKSLNNEKINYARNMLRGRMDARDDIPCTSCGIYSRMKTEGKWLKRRSPTSQKIISIIPPTFKNMVKKVIYNYRSRSKEMIKT